MQFLALVIAVATAIFWLGRAARGARDIADVATRVKNRARLSHFPPAQEAAATLMICIARLSNYSQMHDGFMSEAAQSKILDLLKTSMHVSTAQAMQLMKSGGANIKDTTQPETSLAPMTNILVNAITAEDARELAHMLRAIAQTGSTINAAQANFMQRYDKRMALSA